MRKNKKSKYSIGLVKGIREEERQNKINHRKDMANHFFFNIVSNPIVGIIRTLATILLLILATVGLLSLLYPETRHTIYGILHDYYNQILSLLSS